jgi:RNA polymerase sigma-70 factor (ECF subfamily)
MLLVEDERGVALVGGDRQETRDHTDREPREQEEDPAAHAVRVDRTPRAAPLLRGIACGRENPHWRLRPVEGIISRVRDDDFERLYAAQAEPLLGFLVYRTGDRAMAEDLLSDTFERVLRTRFRFDPRKSSEKTWIYTIALNLLRDQARRHAAEERALERAPSPTSGSGRAAVDLIDERDELRRALGQLTKEEREAVALRYGADLTVPEIGRVTGEKVSTVEGRVYRGLRKMRDQLDRD